jgi:hypothetical protein
MVLMTWLMKLSITVNCTAHGEREKKRKRRRSLTDDCPGGVLRAVLESVELSETRSTRPNVTDS